jgi:predicted transglutaminase-like cysteine proteinase
MAERTVLRRLGVVISASVLGAALVGFLAVAGLDPLRQTLDEVNLRTKHALTYRPGVQWSFGRVGDCTTFALHNYLAVKALGLRPEIWSVLDERGEGHAVVAVGPDVLDNRFWHVQTRRGLERRGYRFRTAVDFRGPPADPRLASR